MDSAEIEQLTRSRFPDWEPTPNRDIEVIDRAGSGRRFFRLLNSGRNGKNLFAMHYSLDRRENGRFVEITSFLDGLGVPVPRILAADEDRQLLWQEDLGTTELGIFRRR